VSGFRMLIVVFAGLGLFVGCRSVPPVATDGSKPVFEVYVDPGVSGVSDPVQKKRRSEVGAWMAGDCVDILARGGCAASLASSGTPSGDATRYFLKITIKDYRWRYMGTSLDVEYKLSRGGKCVLSSSGGCGTSRNWRNCCRKINTDIVDAIRDAFSAGKR